MKIEIFYGEDESNTVRVEDAGELHLNHDLDDNKLSVSVHAPVSLDDVEDDVPAAPDMTAVLDAISTALGFSA
jgi:hypothetical protein